MGLLITTEDALAPNAAEVVFEKQAIIRKAIDDLLALPRGKARWRGAVDLYLKLNLSSTKGLTAREEYDITVSNNRMNRDVQINKYGTSGDTQSENLRYQLEMPAGAHRLIELVDPNAFKTKNIAALRKTLPEFCIAEVY